MTDKKPLQEQAVSRGVTVPLSYKENPELKAADIAALRRAVGWDSRQEKLEKIVGCTYMTAACFDKDRLVGCVDVLSDGVDDAFIRNLLVDPAYQGLGVGLNLLRMVVEKARANKIKTVNVLFEPELENFYRKAGFRILKGGMIDNEAQRA